MAVFPETAARKPQYGYDNSPLENVKRTAPEAGNSYIRDSWGLQRFAATMDLLLTRYDAKILWAWYELNRNLAFTMFDFEWSNVSGLSAGTGNGVTDIFTVPGKEIEAGGVVTSNAVPVAFTILPASGTLGEDRVQLAIVPANGHAVTFTGSLRRRYLVEFVEAAKRRSISFNRILISMRVRQRFPL